MRQRVGTSRLGGHRDQRRQRGDDGSGRQHRQRHERRAGHRLGAGLAGAVGSGLQSIIEMRIIGIHI
jgi:hypothetical protein